MVVHSMPTVLRIEPPFPVEQAVTVDDEALRVALEWPVIEHLTGERNPDPATVRAALHEHRLTIERTIKAHLFAHGFPLSGELALSLGDFRAPRA
ncbi:MAG: hypothetical protein U1F10_00735 [Burkholderiales bacterium]